MPFNLCNDLSELNVKERLNYLLGQVLGVKDFQQEQVYFLHKARLQNRSLHGYGTVWGLDVDYANTEENLELQVSPGLAIDPQGREVCVEALQCAALNTWLAAADGDGSATANWENLEPVAEGSASVAVYVVLCYHPCQTGAQPILGDPCRTDTGTNGVIQYTRIRDYFELQLRPKPPLHLEEAWVRAIANILDLINIDPTAPELDPEALDSLEEQFRHAVDDPSVIDTIDPVTLTDEQAEPLLRELLRYWVTITRPSLDLLHHPVRELLTKLTIDSTQARLDEDDLQTQLAEFTELLDNYEQTNDLTEINDLAAIAFAPETWSALRQGILQHWARKPAADQPTEDDCLLLAAVEFELTDTNTVNQATLNIENLQRPYLLHTRLLQELLLRGGRQGPQGEQGIQGEQGEQGIQGEPGPGLDQLILRPAEMVLIPNVGDDNEPLPPELNPNPNPNQRLVPAVLSSVNNYPAVSFSPARDTLSFAAFSTLRPTSLRPSQAPRLQLYCAGRGGGGELSWRVVWRWLQALAPGAPVNDNARLTNSNFTPTNTDRFRLQDLVLTRIPSPPLEPGDSLDYLMVYLVPEVTPPGRLGELYLLMAELRWEV